MLSCLVSTLCCDANLDGLVSAGSDCKRLSRETSSLCSTAQDKCQTLISYARDIQSTLSGLGRSRKVTDASTYVQLKSLVEDDKLKESISIALEADDLAEKCVEKSTEMADAMKRGVESLPGPARESIESGGGDEDKYQEEERLIANVDEDVREIERCTKSLKGMNIFSAAKSGSNAFGGLAKDTEVCGVVFEKMTELAGSVTRITEAFMSKQGCCCNQLQTALKEAKEMFSCIQLSKLITKLAEAANRLMKAIVTMLRTAWETFRGFLKEFYAGKKIQNFVGGINPIKDSKAGSFVDSIIPGAGEFMSSLMPGS